MAQALLELRQALAACFRDVQACAGCMRPPTPGWPGGHCCSGCTEQVFTEVEISALRLSGTKPRHLRLPRSDQKGCAFRGPRGCSLHPRHRPTLCVRYTCLELEAELGHAARRHRVAALQRELRVLFDQFAVAWAARREREQAAELEREVLAMCQPSAQHELNRLPEACGRQL